MTNSTHYETYRCRKLTSSRDDGTPTQQLHPLAQLEREGAEQKAGRAHLVFAPFNAR